MFGILPLDKLPHLSWQCCLFNRRLMLNLADDPRQKSTNTRTYCPSKALLQSLLILEQEGQYYCDKSSLHIYRFIILSQNHNILKGLYTF